MVSNFKEPREISEAHRRYIASLPCCMSGLEGSTQCAHIRTGNRAGMGFKSDDKNCVPLSVAEHAKQHSMSEKAYWGEFLPDAQRLARDLWACSGDMEMGRGLIDRFRWQVFRRQL